MSKEQVTEQRPGQDPAAQTTDVQDQTYGLRNDLYAQIQRMNPADDDKLGKMLVNYPQFSGQILAVAAHHLGNAAVRRAIALAKQIKATSGQGSSLGQDEVRESLSDPLDSRTVTAKEMPSFIEGASDVQVPDEPASAPKPAPAADPAWVAEARHYNGAHSHLVAEFNDLTDYVCLDDDTTKLDPKAVFDWQRGHGLDPDGKVGPRTVAAARAAKSKGPSVAKAEQPDARIPV
jgi:hypothetical protein